MEQPYYENNQRPLLAESRLMRCSKIYPPKVCLLCPQWRGQPPVEDRKYQYWQDRLDLTHYLPVATRARYARKLPQVALPLEM